MYTENNNNMCNIQKNPIMFIWFFYAVCFVFRAVEYFVVRTDQGIIGEAFIHKLTGIGLLAIAIHIWGYKWRDIVFRADNTSKGICYDLLFGSAVCAIAYAVEMFINQSAGNMPSLERYV